MGPEVNLVAYTPGYFTSLMTSLDTCFGRMMGSVSTIPYLATCKHSRLQKCVGINRRRIHGTVRSGNNETVFTSSAVHYT